MSSNIKFIQGNIFTSDCQSLVNTVNCVGVMGAGIALEFKYRYPEMFRRYVEFCKAGKMQIGFLYVYEISPGDRKVINFPTKKDWKNPSKPEYLRKGLEKFLETYRTKGVTSAAFPLLGAQNGGLDPMEVQDMMKEYLRRADIPIEIYEYTAGAKDDLIDGFRDSLLYGKNEFKKSTGLTETQVEKIRDAVLNREMSSLIGLTKVKGIGEETIKECFQFAMKVKAGKLIEPPLFKAHGPGSPLISEEEKSEGHIGDKASPLPPADVVPEPVKGEETPLEGQEETVIAEEPPKEKKDAAPDAAPIEKTGPLELQTEPAAKKVKAKKPAGTSRKTSSAKSLSIDQKVLLTSLTAEIILRIEAGSEDVTISDLRAYAEGTKQKWKKFITDKYLGKPSP